MMFVGFNERATLVRGTDSCAGTSEFTGGIAAIVFHAHWFRSMIVFVIALVLPGCAALKPKDSKAEAEQHWGQVRARVKNQLAAQQYTGGYFDECIKTASEAVTLDPSSTDAHMLLARANLELSRPASAQQAIDAARERGLRSAELSYTEGVILEQRELASAAVEKYREALAQNPANADALLAAAELLVELDKPAEARTLLREHADRVDNKPAVLLLSARVARLVHDADEAVNRYMDALGFTDQSPRIAEEAGLYFAELRRCSLAAAVLEPLIARNADGTFSYGTTPVTRGSESPSQSVPEHGSNIVEPTSTGEAVTKALAACRLETNDAEGARLLLAPWVARHPDDAAAQLLLAKSALATGDLRLAIASVDAARQGLPHSAEVRFVRALIDWKRGAIDNARTATTQLVAQDPKDADARCLLGELLAESGDPAGAAASFQQALDLAPGSPWAASGLARATEAAGSR